MITGTILAFSLNMQNDQLKASAFFGEASENRSEFKHIPALDGMRGISVLAVMFYHLGFFVPEINPYASGGFMGVQLFFVLSGFLITSILLKEIGKTGGINLKNFYWRRTLRLVPAFWAYLLVIYVSVGAILPAAAAAKYDGYNFAAAFFYVMNWQFYFSEHNLVFLLIITWSLAIEEQFYVFWGLTLAVMVKLKVSKNGLFFFTLGLIFLIILARNLRALSGEPPHNLYHATDTRIDAILIGCVAAFVYMWRVPLNQKYFNRLAVLCTGAMAVCFAVYEYKQVETYITGLPLFSFSAAILILWFANKEKSFFHKLLENRPLRYVGEISYGLYLWNMLGIMISDRFFDSKIMIAGGALVLTFCFAAFSFKFIERPFLKMKSRFS